MQRGSTITTLLLLLVTSITQAKTPLPALPDNNGVKETCSEGHRNETVTDSSSIASNSSSRITHCSGVLRKIDEGLTKEFVKAWNLSDDGTSGREGVVLIFRMGDGSYSAKSQGFTNQYRRFTFRWNPAALAIVHTHPDSCDPKPSEQDRRISDQYGVPNFTISIHGMYVYDPATRKTSKVLNGLDWLEPSKLAQEMERSLQNSTQGEH